MANAARVNDVEPGGVVEVSARINTASIANREASNQEEPSAQERETPTVQLEPPVATSSAPEPSQAAAVLPESSHPQSSSQPVAAEAGVTADAAAQSVRRLSKARSLYQLGLVPSQKVTKEDIVQEVLGEEPKFSPDGGFHELRIDPSEGPKLVGRAVKVYWPLDGAWYAGKVQSYDPERKRHAILYDDGDIEQVNVKRERVQVLLQPGEELGKLVAPNRRRRLELQARQMADVQEPQEAPLATRSGSSTKEGRSLKRSAHNAAQGEVETYRFWVVETEHGLRVSAVKCSKRMMTPNGVQKCVGMGYTGKVLERRDIDLQLPSKDQGKLRVAAIRAKKEELKQEVLDAMSEEERLRVLALEAAGDSELSSEEGDDTALADKDGMEVEVEVEVEDTTTEEPAAVTDAPSTLPADAEVPVAAVAAAEPVEQPQEAEPVMDVVAVEPPKSMFPPGPPAFPMLQKLGSDLAVPAPVLPTLDYSGPQRAVIRARRCTANTALWEVETLVEADLKGVASEKEDAGQDAQVPSPSTSFEPAVKPDVHLAATQHARRGGLRHGLSSPNLPRIHTPRANGNARDLARDSAGRFSSHRAALSVRIPMTAERGNIDRRHDTSRVEFAADSGHLLVGHGTSDTSAGDVMWSDMSESEYIDGNAEYAESLSGRMPRSILDQDIASRLKQQEDECVARGAVPANVLVTETDRCWRQSGVLAVFYVEADRRCIMRIEKERQVLAEHQICSDHVSQDTRHNRVSRSLIWRAEDTWSLEFTSKPVYMAFKRLFAYHFHKTLVANISIPTYRELDMTGAGRFARPAQYTSTLPAPALDNADDESRPGARWSVALYTADSEDEDWLYIRARKAATNEGRLTVEGFEDMIDSFEKQAAIKQRHHQLKTLCGSPDLHETELTKALAVLPGSQSHTPRAGVVVTSPLVQSHTPRSVASAREVECEMCWQPLSADEALAAYDARHEGVDTILAVHSYWFQKRAKRGMPLLRHFQPSPWLLWQRRLRVDATAKPAAFCMRKWVSGSRRGRTGTAHKVLRNDSQRLHVGHETGTPRGFSKKRARRMPFGKSFSRRRRDDEFGTPRTPYAPIGMFSPAASDMLGDFPPVQVSKAAAPAPVSHDTQRRESGEGPERGVLLSPGVLVNTSYAPAVWEATALQHVPPKKTRTPRFRKANSPVASSPVANFGEDDARLSDAEDGNANGDDEASPEEAVRRDHAVDGRGKAPANGAPVHPAPSVRLSSEPGEPGEIAMDEEVAAAWFGGSAAHPGQDLYCDAIPWLYSPSRRSAEEHAQAATPLEKAGTSNGMVLVVDASGSSNGARQPPPSCSSDQGAACGSDSVPQSGAAEPASASKAGMTTPNCRHVAAEPASHGAGRAAQKPLVLKSNTLEQSERDRVAVAGGVNGNR
eukprot:jgi/Chlat1/1344/Chrsp119S01756